LATARKEQKNIRIEISLGKGAYAPSIRPQFPWVSSLATARKEQKKIAG
jgi:hypothetical protein